MPTVSQRIVLQSSKIPCPDQLAERISWTMAGLPTTKMGVDISRICKPRHHISTPKKLTEMFPSNPSQSPHPKHWHLMVYWRGSCGLATASKVCAARWQMICSATASKVCAARWQMICSACGEKCWDLRACVLQSSKIPCPELFELNIAPSSKFQTDWLAERISWTIACLPTESTSRAGTTFSPPRNWWKCSRPIRPNLHTPNIGTSRSIGTGGGKRFETQQWREVSR